MFDDRHTPFKVCVTICRIYVSMTCLIILQVIYVNASRSPEAISCGLDESPDRQEALCILHTRVVDRERVWTENCGTVAACWDASSF